MARKNQTTDSEKGTPKKFSLFDIPVWISVPVSLVTIVVLYATFYYNFLPQIEFHSQIYNQIGTNNYNPNTCQAYSQSVCPLSLVNKQISFVYLENIGEVPASFSVTFASNTIKFNNELYTSYSTFEKGANKSFAFSPDFTNVKDNFSITVNAFCTSEFFFGGCRGSQQITKPCYYVVNSSSQTATLISN